MTGPNFSPKGGIGTIWKDPTTGKTWKYSQTGWVEQGSGDIAADNKSNGTFQVKPQDEGIVDALKVGGAKEADIQNALQQRQQILATKQTNTTSADEDISLLKSDSSDPFGGKTKIDVLREAFNNGVTDSSELDKIGKTYDLLAAQNDFEGADLSTMDQMQKQAYITNIKNQAIKKIQALPDATARDGAVGSLAVFDSGRKLISMLESGQVTTGLVQGSTRQGVFGIGARSLGKTTPEEDYFNSASEIFAANFRKAMSGAQVGEQEMARLDRFLPGENKTKQQNIEGIMALSDYLADRTNIQLGMDISSLKPEDNNDPLHIFGGSSSKDNPLGI